MPVSVKDYLDTMKSVSSSTKVASPKEDLKTQALLSQLIEAISYANSVDIRQKALNAQSPGTAKAGETGKQVLETMKSQEKLVKQLADGQKLTSEQTKELRATIDKFYELIGAQEVNYKKFAANLEKFALQDLPEAVKTRLINDSRDAHMIGQEQKNESGVILPILKRIRNLLEDSAENTKQFTKKLFVSLDAFKQGLLGAFDKFMDGLKDLRPENIIDKIANVLNGIGMAHMLFSQMFKQGNFKWGQLVKQFDNIRTAFKAFSEIGGIGAGINKSFKAVKTGISSIQSIFKTFGRLPKFIEKLGLGKGLGAATKSIGKSIGKGLGKQVLKKIPLIGTVFSIWMGIERWQRKDYLGAFLEFGSGIAAIFPGIGTLISIGIDLINLGRDTGVFSKLGQSAGAAMSNAIQKIPDSALLAIPGIGTVFGIVKSINLFKSNNKKEGMKMLGTAIASLIPGGGLLANALYSLLDLNIDLSPKTTPTWTPPTTIKKQKPGTSGQKIDDYEWGDGPFGDAPIRWQNESGGYSPRGLTSNAKTAAENFNKAVGGGLVVTSAYRDPAKMMAEWNAATPIPGSKNRRNRWGNEMADPRRSNHRFGTAIDVPMSLYRKIGRSKFTSLAKKSGFNLVYPENTAVHLEVPKNGKVASNDSNSSALGANSSIEPLYENQDVMNKEGSAELEIPDTFEGLMQAFNTLNEKMVEGVEPVNGSVQPVKSSPTVSSDDLAAGTPAAVTASATSETAKNSKQPINSFAGASNIQSAPISDNSGTTDTMDTEIRDTDLALLNSILFN